MATRPIKWRILAIFAGSSLDSAVLKDENSENSCLDEVTDLVGSDAEVPLLRLWGQQPRHQLGKGTASQGSKAAAGVAGLHSSSSTSAYYCCSFFQPGSPPLSQLTLSAGFGQAKENKTASR